MRIALDYKIEIDVREGNKTKEKLTIFFREFTQKEKREHSALQKRFKSIFKQAQKLGNKRSSIDKKAELYELDGKYSQAIKAVENREKIDEELEKLNDELVEIGGEDQDEFAEDAAKKRFELLVSGEDKEKLEEYGEIKGFSKLMRLLDAEKAALEKKQSGESASA